MKHAWMALALAVSGCGGPTEGTSPDGSNRDAGRVVDGGAADVGRDGRDASPVTDADAGDASSAVDAARVEPLACEVAAGGCDEVLGGSGGWLSITDRHIPGRTLCIRAGTYSQLYLSRVHGDPGAPVTIVNCGGQVVFDTTGQQVGIQGIAVQHLHLTGTGDPAVRYGIVDRNAGLHGIDFDPGITDIEIDHVEVDHAQWVGIGVRSYPRCDGEFHRGNWTQEDTFIHDNYVHDCVQGEGMYIGTSHYDRAGLAYAASCPQYLEPALRRVRVVDNRVIDTGADGIQVGGALEGMEIARNVVLRYARTQDAGDVGGLQINPGSVGEVHHNWVESFEGDRVGTAVQYAGGDAGDIDIHDNVLVGAGIGLLALGHMIASTNRTIFRDNTVVERHRGFPHCVDPDGNPTTDDYACREIVELYCNPALTAAAPHAMSMMGNLFVDYDAIGRFVFDDGTDPWFQIFRGPASACPIDGHVYPNARERDLQIPGNFYARDLAAAGFVDAAAGDFHLQAGSAATGFGADLDLPRP